MIVAIVVMLVLLNAAAFGWWLTLERRKDQVTAAISAALDADDYEACRDGWAERDRIVNEQRWPIWILRLGSVFLGTMLGRYLGLRA